MWGAALTGKFIALMLTLIKREFSNHSPKLPPKETKGGGNQFKYKARRKAIKFIIYLLNFVRMEINELKIAKKKIHEDKSQFLEKINKTDKTLVRLNKKKERKYKLPKLKMKEGISILTPQTSKGKRWGTTNNLILINLAT